MAGAIAFIAFSLFSIESSLSWSFLTARTPHAACELDTLKGSFTIGGTATNVTVQVAMTNGMLYEPGTAVFAGGTTLLSENISNLRRPVFSIANPSGTVRFHLLRQAECQAYSSQISGGTFADTVKIYENGMQIGGEEISNPYAIGYGILSLSGVITSPSSALIGQRVSRSVTITNGNFGKIDSFLFAEIYLPGALIVDSFKIQAGGATYHIPSSAIHQTTDLDSTYLSFGQQELQHIGDGDQWFENGETFVLEYSLIINSCGSGSSISSTPTVWWGCGDGYCQRYQLNAGIALAQAEPDLSYMIEVGASGCMGYGEAPDTLNVIIVNNGSGPATEIEFGFQTQHPSQGGFDASHVLYQINGGPEVPITLTDLDKPVTDAFGCASSWTGSGALYSGGKVFLDILLNPGSEVRVRFLNYNCCPDACMDPTLLPDNSLFYGTSYRVDGYFRFKNQCGFNQQDLGQGSLTNELMSLVYSTFSPPNLSESSPLAYTYLDFQELSINGLSKKLNESQFVLEVSMPNCINLGGGPSSIEWANKDGVTLFAPQSVQVTDSGFVAIWNVGTMTSSQVVDLDGTQIRFPCEADCSEGNCTESNVNLSFSFIPSTSCLGACELKWICVDAPINVLCPGICPEGGGQLLGSVFERQNLGRPDADNNGCPDDDNLCNGAGAICPIAFNPGLVRRDRALTGDTIISTVTGVILSGSVAGSWQYLFFENQLSDASLFDIVDADMRFVDVSQGNISYTASGLLPTVIQDTVRLNLSIDQRATALGLPSSSIRFEQGDSIEVTLRYRLNENLSDITQTITTLNRLYTATISAPTLSGRYDCATTGGTILAGKPGVSDYKSWITFPTGCTTKNIGFNTEVALDGSSSGNNFFPFEYRVWARPQKYHVTIPEGYHIEKVRLLHRRTTGNGTVSSSRYTPAIVATDTISHSDGAFTYIYDIHHPVNAGIWAGQGGNYYYGDDGAYFRFHTDASPGCASPEAWYSDIAGGNAYLQQHEYLDLLGERKFRSGSTNLIFTKPDVNASCSVPVKQGVSTNIEWELNVKNLSSNIPVNNAWIALVSPSGMIGSGQKELYNQAGSLLSPTASGIYQLGTLAKNTSRTFKVKADYSTCDQDSMLFLVGWDCDDYPSTLGDYPCNVDTVVLHVVPVEGHISVQVTDLALTPTNPAISSSPFFGSDSILLCENFPVEFKLNSALPGDLRDVFTIMEVPISSGMGGLEYVAGSGYFEYPIGSTPQPFSSAAEAALIGQNGGGQFLFDWSDISGGTLPSGAELPGTSQPAANRAVYFRFNMRATCAMPVGDKFNIRAFANYGCGAPASGFGESYSGSSLPVEGVLPDYATTINVGTIPAFTNFKDTHSVRISIEKYGSKPVGIGDSLMLRLPNGLSLETINDCVSGNCPDYSLMSTYLIGEQKVYMWPMPAMADGEVSEFNLHLRLEKNLYGILGLVELQTRNQQQLSCSSASDGLCPVSGVVVSGTGSRATSADLPEVLISIDNFIANQEFQTSFKYITALSLVIGSKEAPDGFWVELYCADMLTGQSTGQEPLQTVFFPGPIAFGTVLDTLLVFYTSTCFPPDQPLIALIPDSTYDGSLTQCFQPVSQGLSRAGVEVGGNPFDIMEVESVLLPLEWIHTQASQEEGEILLVWTTAQDALPSSFEIDRKTPSGRFEKVGVMTPKSDKIASYIWEEPVPAFNQDHYYRIRAIGMDGKEEISPIVEVAVASAKQNLMVEHNSPEEKIIISRPTAEFPATLRVWTMQGQPLYEKALAPGESSIEVPTGNWATGMYLISLSTNSITISKKVIVR
ncbi:MAG: T9SS type A sorting domain-containing protein [Bacteroidia bacterium]|nr:T9SS type A sorting domain-containing protein [Bacteroidia bacterium]